MSQKLLKSAMAATVLAICSTVLLSSLKSSANREVINGKEKGQKVYQQYCAECHADGGNKVNPNKPLGGSTKLLTYATFKAYLEAPVGHMPYYPHIIADEGLLKGLYEYCKALPKPSGKQAGVHNGKVL